MLRLHFPSSFFPHYNCFKIPYTRVYYAYYMCVWYIIIYIIYLLYRKIVVM
nr:MAG TPA: hypothetical protein [Caudoviricetes sp.]